MNIDLPLCFISVTPVDDEIDSNVDVPAIGVNRATPAKYSDSMKSHVVIIMSDTSYYV